MLRRFTLATLDIVVGAPIRGIIVWGVIVTAAGLWLAHHVPTASGHE
jgi:hypothetical protein